MFLLDKLRDFFRFCFFLVLCVFIGNIVGEEKLLLKSVSSRGFGKVLFCWVGMMDEDSLKVILMLIRWEVIFFWYFDLMFEIRVEERFSVMCC